MVHPLNIRHIILLLVLISARRRVSSTRYILIISADTGRGRKHRVQSKQQQEEFLGDEGFDRKSRADMARRSTALVTYTVGSSLFYLPLLLQGPDQLKASTHGSSLVQERAPVKISTASAAWLGS